MPYSRSELLQAVRTDHPEFNAVPDNKLFAAIAVDHPDLAAGISELHPTNPDAGTLGETTLGALTLGVNPSSFLDRIAGALSSVTNTAVPAGDVKSAKNTLPELNPQEEIGSKVAALGAVAPLVESGVGALGNLLPTTAKAGQKFDQVMAAAKDVPIDTSAAQDALARAQELRQRGSTLPKVLNDFAKNRTAAGDTPMTYEVGRDFASNAGALSTREVTAMNAKMQSQVAQFAVAMKDANREAAAKVGMGDLYDAAMKEYRQAKNLQDAGEILKKWGARALIVAGLGAAGREGYNLYSQLTGK